MLFNKDFGDSAFLGAGYNPCWGTPWGMNPPSTMAVYGNGGIHLYYEYPYTPPPPSQANLVVRALAWDAELDPHEITIPVEFNVAGQNYTTLYGYYYPFTPLTLPIGYYPLHFQDSLDGGLRLQRIWIHYGGSDEYYYDTDTVFVLVGSETTCVNANYGYSLNVSSTGGGNVTEAGTHVMWHGDTLSVNATPSAGYTLNYWLLDGDYAGYNSTFAFSMDTEFDHTLEAVFCAQGQETRYNLTVTAWSQGMECVPSQVWIDNVPVGYANGNPFVVCPGSHVVTLEGAVQYSGPGVGWGLLWVFNSEELLQTWTTVYLTEDTSIGANYMHD